MMFRKPLAPPSLLDEYAATRTMNEGRPLTNLTISTHVPGKWRFVDLETGEVWRAGGTEKDRFAPANDIIVIFREKNHDH